jgi:hypothetical protein
VIHPRTSLIEVRRAGERFHTATPGIESWHSFSFGAHYDPTNVSHGALVAHNDETLAPGAGFDPHPHRDVEIVTYVVSGSLVYSDNSGRIAVARPGLVQLASAGRGIVHSERNASATEPVRFIQMWIAPTVRGVEPSYHLVSIDAPVRLNTVNAQVSLSRLAPGDSLALPMARFVHVFVVGGTVRAELAGNLGPSDALRLTDTTGSRVVATATAELLVWQD